MTRTRSFYRRLLVATDFSPGSGAALRSLDRLLPRSAPVHIDLAHVLEPMPFLVPPAPVIGFERARTLGAQRRLERVADDLRKRFGPSVQVETHVLEGPPHAEICRVAVVRKADLVILGTHGRTGLGHALAGSVAERVVRHAGRPVLTIPMRVRRSR